MPQYLCCEMKIQRKILFNILFLLWALCCSGLNAYSNFNNQTIFIENATNDNYTDKSISSESDSNDDDQIIYNNIYDYYVELDSQIIENSILIPNITLSIWLPPKVS
jgi:hypothetical protein